MTSSDIASMLAGAGLLGVGAAIAWVIETVLHKGRCFCGHPPGCGNTFGECTRKIRVRAYGAGGRRAGWKYEPCKCRDHGRTEQKAITT